MAVSIADPKPFPLFPVLGLPHVAFILLIVTRASRLWRASYIVSYTAYILYACFELRRGNYITDSVLTSYIVGTAVSGQVLCNVALLWFLEEDISGRKVVLDVVRHEDDAKEKIPPSERGLLQRLWWAFCLDQSPRNVGWSIQVKNVPKQDPATTRTSFVLYSLIHGVKLYLMVDAGIWYTHLPHVVYGAGARSMASLPFIQRCLTVYFLGAAGYATIYLQYTWLSIVCVGLGFSEAKRWPNLFGRWRDAYTVRRFWGMVWHQILRRFTSPLSSVTAKLLRLPRGTRLSSNVQLIVGFGLSAAVHLLGDITTGVPLSRPSAIFFLVQPLAIMFEDLVLEFFNGGRNKPSKLTGVALGAARVVGYCWVFGWFVLSLPLFADPQIRVGLGETRAIPKEWSVVERLATMYSGAA